MSIKQILLILAAVCFFVAAFVVDWEPLSRRVNLNSFGLFLATLSLIIQ